MDVGILGPLSIQTTGGPVEIRRATPRVLLVALVVRAPDTVPASALADMLWDERLPQNPANALQLQVSFLRKALGADASAIVTRSGGYALELSRDDVDAHRFEAMVRAAHQDAARPDGLHRALATLDDALGLWRGEALADAAGLPFAVGEATRLDELRWTAIERRHDVLLALGRHDEAVGQISGAIAAQPLREGLHAQLALALYRCGRQADALRRIDAARSLLRDELGVDPGPSLQELERRILEQDPALAPATVPAEPAPAPSHHEPAQRATALPVALTPLIGREPEIAKVGELLGRHRLVTLTGPGGAGKSRLALEVARQHAAADVCFVDLGAVDDDDLVAPAVAATLGLPTAPGEDAAGAIAVAVARQQNLFLFDTCEHVVGGVAALAGRVLGQAPDARVLATSRRAIGLTGEIAWPVPPLSLAPPWTNARDLGAYPSAALFCARAEAVRPDFEVTDDNAADIAAICLALDGLPLAIELAAARADALTPAAIHARLQDRFALLVDGGRDAAPRQQTLRATLDWSSGLLTEEQRCFFARLSVFVGGFDLDAAVAVAGAGFDDPVRLLTDLVRQSMVVAIGGDRFRVLDTLRLYGQELLAGADADEARARHVAHFVVLAEAAEQHVRSGDQLEWLPRLRVDVANLRAATEWSFETGDGESGARLAGALAWFWTLDGMLDEAVRHLERAVETPGLPALVRAKVLWGYALQAASLGRLHRAREAGVEAAALGRSVGDDAATGCGLNATAVSEWALGNLDAAAAAHDEAIACFGRAGDMWGLAICLVLRARTALDQGDERALPMAEEGLVAARHCGDRHVIGIALAQIAMAQRVQGSLDDVLAVGKEALRVQESIGYTEGIIAALHLLGEASLANGEPDEAETMHTRALGLAERIGHAAALCEALEGLAQVRAAHGRDEEALALLVVAAGERRDRQLPGRASDEAVLSLLREKLTAGVGGDVTARAASVELPELISSLLG